MNYFFKKLIFIFLSIILNSSIYAKNIFKLNDYQCVESRESVNKLDVYISDCGKKINKMDSYEVPANDLKIDYIFSNNFKDKYNIFLGISYSEDYRDPLNRFNYLNKYYMIRAYECNKNNFCKENEKLSNFFGSGGDIIDYKHKKIIYKFPYYTQSDLKNELNSKLFKDWMNGNLDSGIVLRKTFINDVNNFTPEHIGYLIKGDKFKIKEVSSRWLNIVYTNKNGRTTSGWIACQDTTVCN
ncbi:hypothetical protein [Acinetobacter sp. SA01]|uniref:hypothetical protein n=1 Tax=Acinetobacter sp. SA01 TaxID=1862567 RepID=UPI00140875F1|nr:hypothetical protein [Acinetobacter sp. SA01]